jgi:hypothetical protein
MNKKEVQTEILRLLSLGGSKSEVFRLMRGGVVGDRKIAHLIASYAAPALCEKYGKLIIGVVTVAWIQLVIFVLLIFTTSWKFGFFNCVMFTGLAGCLGYLFVWGFAKNKAWAYNVTIFLNVVNSHKLVEGFFDDPVINSIKLLIRVALVAFVWYVRSKVFPDFYFFSPRKNKGEYVFSS